MTEFSVVALSLADPPYVAAHRDLIATTRTEENA